MAGLHARGTLPGAGEGLGFSQSRGNAGNGHTWASQRAPQNIHTELIIIPPSPLWTQYHHPSSPFPVKQVLGNGAGARRHPLFFVPAWMMGGGRGMRGVTAVGYCGHGPRRPKGEEDISLPPSPDSDSIHIKVGPGAAYELDNSSPRKKLPEGSMRRTTSSSAYTSSYGGAGSPREAGQRTPDLSDAELGSQWGGTPSSGEASSAASPPPAWGTCSPRGFLSSPSETRFGADEVAAGAFGIGRRAHLIPAGPPPPSNKGVIKQLFGNDGEDDTAAHDCHPSIAAAAADCYPDVERERERVEALMEAATSTGGGASSGGSSTLLQLHPILVRGLGKTFPGPTGGGSEKVGGRVSLHAARRLARLEVADCPLIALWCQLPHNAALVFSPPQEAVRGLTLGIERGECFGLLGPNGAGKVSNRPTCAMQREAELLGPERNVCTLPVHPACVPCLCQSWTTIRPRHVATL